MGSDTYLAVDQTTAAKFYPFGAPRPYPGNTISAALLAGHCDIEPLVSIVEALKSEPASRHFRFLPAKTWHMTVMRGVNEAQRTSKSWPEGLSMHQPLVDATRKMANRIHGTFLPRSLSLSVSAITMNTAGEIRVELEAGDENARQQINRMRAALSKAIKHRRRDAFLPLHMTLAYRVKAISKSENTFLTSALEHASDRFIPENAKLVFGSPNIIQYQDMLDFDPRGRPSWKTWHTTK